MNKGKVPSYRKTVLVDTNALHLARTYLIYGKKEGLPPFGPSKTLSEMKSGFKPSIVTNYRDTLCKGYRILGYLQRLSKSDNTRIFVSAFSELELLHGLLEGKAHMKMSEQGMPYRMRQRLSDLSRLVCFHLGSDDCAETIKEFDEIIEELRNSGVEITKPAPDKYLPEILSICNVIQSRVFIDPFDCLIYGNALVLMTDTVVSLDGYFKDVINRIENPKIESLTEQRKLWKEAQDEIKGKLAGIIGASKKEIRFPQCPGIPSTSVVLVNENA